jgi:hypothetical protein
VSLVSSHVQAADDQVMSPFDLIGIEISPAGRLPMSLDEDGKQALFDRFDNRIPIDITGFPLSSTQTVDLKLGIRSVRPARATDTIMRADGSVDQITAESTVRFEGMVLGQPGSYVRLSIERNGTFEGFIDSVTIAGQRRRVWFFESGQVASSHRGSSGVPNSAGSITSGSVRPRPAEVRSSFGASGGVITYKTQIILELTKSYREMFHSTAEAIAHAERAVAYVNEINMRDFRSQVEVTELRVWETEEPFFGSVGVGNTNSLTGYWRGPNCDYPGLPACSSIPRHAVVALFRRYTGAIDVEESSLSCEHYATVSMEGILPVGLDGRLGHTDADDADLVVLAHELAHAHGAGLV